jgi:hypothetical protein
MRIRLWQHIGIVPVVRRRRYELTKRPWQIGGREGEDQGGGAIIDIDHSQRPAFLYLVAASLSGATAKIDIGGALKNGRTIDRPPKALRSDDPTSRRSRKSHAILSNCQPRRCRIRDSTSPRLQSRPAFRPFADIQCRRLRRGSHEDVSAELACHNSHSRHKHVA